MSRRTVTAASRHGEPPQVWSRLGTREPLVELPGAGGSPSVLRVQLPSASGSSSVARSLVSVLLDGRGIAEACRSDVVLAVSEASSNAIEYGAGPHIDVCVELDDEGCLVSVSNRLGQFPSPFARDLAEAPPGARMPGASAPRGRGIAIMDVVMDQVAIDLAGDRCIVEMFRRIER